MFRIAMVSPYPLWLQQMVAAAAILQWDHAHGRIVRDRLLQSSSLQLPIALIIDIISQQGFDTVRTSSIPMHRDREHCDCKWHHLVRHIQKFHRRAATVLC